MRKNALLALLLVCALMFSGCALVVKDQDVDDAQVIIDVNGETVNKKTYLAKYQSNLSTEQYYAQYYYSMMGYEMTVDEAQIRQDTLDTYVSDLIKSQKVKELGFDVFTDEELAAIQTTADESYASMLDQVKSYYFADTELEGDELDAQLKTTAETLGITPESELESAKNTAALKKLKDSVIAGVTVDDTDLQAALDEKIASAKTSYESSLSAYGYAVNNGSTVYYTPAGYRYVKHILVKLLDEDTTAISAIQTELTEANTALTDATAKQTENTTAQAAEGIEEDALNALKAEAETIDAEVAAAQANVDEITIRLTEAQDNAYAHIEGKANEIYEMTKTGDFDALMAEYGEDPGMQSEPAMSTGYAVCEGFTYFDTAFTAGAMALANIGDVSEPVKGTNGYHIIQYTADIPEGDKTLDETRDALHDSTLTTKQDSTYEAQITAWGEEGSVNVYEDRIDN